MWNRQRFPDEGKKHGLSTGRVCTHFAFLFRMFRPRRWNDDGSLGLDAAAFRGSNGTDSLEVAERNVVVIVVFPGIKIVRPGVGAFIVAIGYLFCALFVWVGCGGGFSGR